MLSIEVPDGYSYVLFTCGMLPSITNFLLSQKVMSARAKFKIPLPNLYAVPGLHKEADAFNRVQRGHQHVIESISDFRTASFIGALKHPMVCAVSGVFYCLGNFMYQVGYADVSSDVKFARMKKGGFLQFFAQVVQLGCGVSACVSLLKQ